VDIIQTGRPRYQSASFPGRSPASDLATGDGFSLRPTAACNIGICTSTYGIALTITAATIDGNVVSKNASLLGDGRRLKRPLTNMDPHHAGGSPRQPI
jgi:hypothetical protein